MGGKENIKKALPWIAAGGALAACFSVFSGEKRAIIFERDHYMCQGEGCRFTSVVPHHITPECLENGNSHSSEGSDVYNTRPLVTYNAILRTIPADLVDPFRRSVRNKIRSEMNGISLCEHDHVALHSGSVDHIRLKRNPQHPERPRVLSGNNAQGFLLNQIINPVMEELDLPPFTQEEIKQLLRGQQKHKREWR